MSSLAKYVYFLILISVLLKNYAASFSFTDFNIDHTGHINNFNGNGQNQINGNHLGHDDVDIPDGHGSLYDTGNSPSSIPSQNVPPFNYGSQTRGMSLPLQHPQFQQPVYPRQHTSNQLNFNQGRQLSPSNSVPSTVDREEWLQHAVFHTTNNFNYDPNSPTGPLNWNLLWPQCNGISQSPININTSRVLYGRPYRIHYGNEMKRIVGETLNNGHAPAFYILPRSKALYGVPTMENDVFVLYQLHLHFGNTAIHGSEHAVDMKYYPIEAHLVHYNYKYGDLKNASNYQDGVTAISVLIEVSQGQTSELDSFIQNSLSQNIMPNTTGIATMLDPSAILPYSREFYTYFGSKTTPPCSENTRWIVMRSTKRVSPLTFRTLYNIRDNQGIPLSRYGNYRPLQRCNNRLIEANF